MLGRVAAIAFAATIVLAGIGAALSLRGAWNDARLDASRVALAAWLAALIVPALAGFDPGRSFSLIGLTLLSAAVHLAIVRWWSAPGVARTLLGLAVGGGLVLALVALAMQLLRQPADVYVANAGRATGLFVTPNQFAAWLVPFSALAAGTALATGSVALRRLAAIAAVAGAVALAATFSFGGWLGGVTAFVVAAWWLGRRALAGAAVVVSAAVAVALLVAPGLPHHRADERTVRLDAMQAGVRAALLFPLLGVGPLAYPRVYPLLRVPSTTEDAILREHPHDLTISLFAETGVAGVAAIVFGWWRLGGAIRTGYRTADPRTRRLVACIGAGLIGRFVHGLVDLVGVLELAFVWIPFAAVALAAVQRGAAEP